MIKIRLLFLGFFLPTAILSAQIAKVSAGKLEHFAAFHSKYITARDVDVWIPENYSDQEKYAVLYMHDGQALFDASLTWNKQAWEAEEAASELQSENKTKKFIIVGIHNNPVFRHSEYFPQKAFKMLSGKRQDSLYHLNPELFKGQINSDDYLKFIVRELKPVIDRKFSVLKDRKNTFIAGSSMGGLLSLYAICEYPDIFGGAACLSTHWPGTFNDNKVIPQAFTAYLKRNLPSPLTHKIYFDYGDLTLDSLYESHQKKIDLVMMAKGYSNQQWLTQKFPGADHSEKSWASRLAIPLEFLLKK